ncbi:MAG TPA: carboxypeptidase-like regulatory domain-containing protein [Cyclobacteriaceae bacterium]|nr:carboxypeptidase-like regulatory domain-containing protein [Cyclobacteriaceae bacterium]
MTLRPIVALLACVLIAGTSDAQIHVSGTVVDSATGDPLPYATVSLVGKAIGTITNTDGSFDLHISQTNPSDTLMISMIGYARQKMSVNTPIVGQTIRLKQQAFQLDEVVVVSVDEIFKKIKARVENNYPVDNYYMESFYREIKKYNDEYKSLLEAAVVIEDKGYNHLKTGEDAFVREIRGSSKFVNVYADFWQTNNLLRETLGLNAVRHPTSVPSVYGKFPYKLRGTTKLFDRPVYILASDTAHNEGWLRTIYVDTETYAIYRSEEQVVRRSVTWKVDNRDSVHERIIKGISVFDFRPVNGKLYLNYIRHEVEAEYYNPSTKKIYDRFTSINELVVTDVHRDTKAVKLLSPIKNIALEQQVTPYNEKFWANYNAIRKTPLELEVMKDLTKGTSLQEQFIQSGTGTQSTKKKRR